MPGSGREPALRRDVTDEEELRRQGAGGEPGGDAERRRLCGEERGSDAHDAQDAAPGVPHERAPEGIPEPSRDAERGASGSEAERDGSQREEDAVEAGLSEDPGERPREGGEQRRREDPRPQREALSPARESPRPLLVAPGAPLGHPLGDGGIRAEAGDRADRRDDGDGEEDEPQRGGLEGARHEDAQDEAPDEGGAAPREDRNRGDEDGAACAGTGRHGPRVTSGTLARKLRPPSRGAFRRARLPARFRGRSRSRKEAA